MQLSFTSKKIQRLILSLLLCSAYTIAQANDKESIPSQQPVSIPRYSMKQYDEFISNLYLRTSKQDLQNIDKKIKAFSMPFLGKKYLGGALGEGPDGKFDKNPLYRTDAFDCVTLVSTVLALTEANNLTEFKQIIKKINYKNGVVSHLTRNHFTSVDWNNNNIHNGYLQDITYKFIDTHGQPIAAIAEAIIDKPAWFNKLKLANIHLFEMPSSEKNQQLLAALHAESQHVQKEKSVILYVPLTTLFDAAGQPNNALFDQIPSGSVIEIIRPNWDLESVIGTHLNVSHAGLAIRDERGLIFREASSEKGAVIDIPLTEYLQGFLKSPTIKGINVQKIVIPQG